MLCNAQWDVPDSYDADEPEEIDRYYRLVNRYEDYKEDFKTMYVRIAPLVEEHRLRLKLADHTVLDDFDFVTRMTRLFNI